MHLSRKISIWTPSKTWLSTWWNNPCWQAPTYRCMYVSIYGVCRYIGVAAEHKEKLHRQKDICKFTSEFGGIKGVSFWQSISIHLYDINSLCECTQSCACKWDTAMLHWHANSCFERGRLVLFDLVALCQDWRGWRGGEERRRWNVESLGVNSVNGTA